MQLYVSDKIIMSRRSFFKFIVGVRQKTVYIRVVFMKLGEIDTVKESFTADVFIQARWREPALDGRDKAEKQVREV
jgi:hypothetical protein